MSTKLLKAGLGVCCLVLLGGCRIQSVASFEAATTPNPPATWKGDPYSSGGFAESSGGTIAKTTYGQGANNHAFQKLDPVLDQPEMGSGEQPGEYHGGPGPNGPARQPQPGSSTPDTTRTPFN